MSVTLAFLLNLYIFYICIHIRGISEKTGENRGNFFFSGLNRNLDFVCLEFSKVLSLWFFFLRLMQEFDKNWSQCGILLKMADEVKKKKKKNVMVKIDNYILKIIFLMNHMCCYYYYFFFLVNMYDLISDWCHTF